MNIRNINFDKELRFKMRRSGGAGGQNVNKVATKVELNFDVLNSDLLTSEQKAKIIETLNNRITKEGVLQIIVQEERSQLGNKEIAKAKFYQWIIKCFAYVKKRRPTKPTKGSKEKRLQSKKRTSDIKKQRKRGFD